MRTLLTVFSALTFLVCPLSTKVTSAQDLAAGHGVAEQYWKGNLHTHSFWSDGNDFPEMIVDWYVRHDYNFLALSDHNTLNAGIRWMKLDTIVNRATEGVLERYVERFGANWVETRGENGIEEVRLKPMNEYAPLFQEAGRFLVLAGEEISDRAEGKPVHINATNLRDRIEPQHGETVKDTIRNNLRAIIEQEKQVGRPIFPHVNHPNFGYAITAEDMAEVVQERFFEIYNGHPGVNQLGDDDHISIERMWDVANYLRLAKLQSEPLFGIATDDCHEYHGRKGSRPGRGWVMVKSHFLTPEYLIKALRAGDFYASSGVSLSSINFDSEAGDHGTLSVEVVPDEGQDYTIQFIGSQTVSSIDADESSTSEGKSVDESNARIGVVLKEVKGNSGSYQLTGEELYVRAVVTSSADHQDPSLPNQKLQAWTQPVGWEKYLSSN